MNVRIAQRPSREFVPLLRFNRLRTAALGASAPRYVLMAASVASLLLLTEVMDPWSRPFVLAVGLILVGAMVLLMLVDGVPVRSEMKLLWLGVSPAAIALAVPNEPWRSDWGSDDGRVLDQLCRVVSVALDRPLYPRDRLGWLRQPRAAHPFFTCDR